jgi:predicted TIM-barrel fold metal-dependent hydrolase
MIIDCHCHAGEGDELTGPWDTRASLKNFLHWSEEEGITRTVLFPAFHTDYLLANRAVARIVVRLPGRFFGFAFIHPERDRGRVGELVREPVEEHGFVAEIAHEITS